MSEGCSGYTTASLLWTAALWLEEPRVHDVQSELAFLPPQYGPDLLIRLRSKIKIDWLNLTNFKAYQANFLKHKKDWMKHYVTKKDERDFGYLFVKQELVQISAPPEAPEHSAECLHKIALKDQLPNLEYLLNRQGSTIF